MTSGQSTSTLPMLSILCLTYNHERFVAEALESFVAQVTNFAVEIVVGDDCSTDGTLAAVESYRPLLGERLRVLRSPVNVGVTRNFRRTLMACKGRYVAVCEGDDFWRGRQKLQAQVDFLEAHPDYVMCFHDATVFGPDGDTGVVQLPPRLRIDASPASLVATRPISTLTVCFRNKIAELPPELDHAPVLDLCLWSLLGQFGSGKHLIGIEPAAYRVHSGGVFSSQTEWGRYLMTSQSMLCLARYYRRQGRVNVSNRLLISAVVAASYELSAFGRVKVIFTSAAQFLIHTLFFDLRIKSSAIGLTKLRRRIGADTKRSRLDRREH